MAERLAVREPPSSPFRADPHDAMTIRPAIASTPSATDAARDLLRTRFLAAAPPLAALPGPTIERILSAAWIRREPRGTHLFSPNDPCGGFPIVLEGRVRVVKIAPSGREIRLYRVQSGESCIMSSGSLLTGAPYAATGIAETDVLILAIPRDLFEDLLATEPEFRRYVFGLFSERLAEVMELVEAVAFQRLDQRLAGWLLERGDVVRTTHQRIADDLGSVREIVSRLLRRFEEDGLVTLGREEVRILDREGLARLRTS